MNQTSTLEGRQPETGKRDSIHGSSRALPLVVQLSSNVHWELEIWIQIIRNDDSCSDLKWKR